MLRMPEAVSRSPTLRVPDATAVTVRVVRVLLAVKLAVLADVQ